MILVIGGAKNGKLEFVKDQYGYIENDISIDISDECAVLYGLQDVVREKGTEIFDFLPKMLEKSVIICDEVGCGVVPIEREEREMRENVGRLCIELAKNADTVIRVFCGIGTAIKGNI